MPLQLEIVTAERVVYSDTVDMVIAPAVEGTIGILPRHIPLVTLLEPGELRVKQGNNETVLAISGGFLQVANNVVRVLADTAERLEEIDESRAESARERARLALVERRDVPGAELALRRSQVRLRLVRRRRTRSGFGDSGAQGS